MDMVCTAPGKAMQNKQVTIILVYFRGINFNFSNNKVCHESNQHHLQNYRS